MARTVLRVKRRRNEEAPDIFKVQSSSSSSSEVGHSNRRQKRAKQGDTDGYGSNNISSLMNNIHVTCIDSGNNNGFNRRNQSKAFEIGVKQKQTPQIVFRKVPVNSNNEHKRKAIFEPGQSEVQIVEASFVPDGDDQNKKASSSASIHTVSNKDTGHTSMQNGNNDCRTSFQHHSKKTKMPPLSLKMVEARIILEKDFWKMHSQNMDDKKKAVADEIIGTSTGTGKVTTSSINVLKKKSGKSALRERMKRNAATSTAKTKGDGDASASKSRSRPKPKPRQIILDPLAKKIDDSLCAIDQKFNAKGGSVVVVSDDIESIIMKHIYLLQANASSSSASSIEKYVNLTCSNGSGSLLHLIAIVNSISCAQEVCRIFGNRLHFNIKDGIGKSVMTTAEEVGAHSILQVYSAYGGTLGGVVTDSKKLNGEEGGGDDDDDAMFVYDLYCLDEEAAPVPATATDSKTDNISEVNKEGHGHGHGSDEKKDSSSVASASPPTPIAKREDMNMNTKDDDNDNDNDNDNDDELMTVNMLGGVGYWIDGNFVIDVDDSGAQDGDDSDVDDQSWDSNREDCDANDYPEEEKDFNFAESDDDDDHNMQMHNLETEDNYYQETYYSDDSNSAHRINFRNRPVDWKSSFGNTNFSDPTITSYRSNSNSRCNDADADDDNDNDEYRGFMNMVTGSGSQNNLNNEGLSKDSVAYDPHFDDDN